MSQRAKATTTPTGPASADLQRASDYVDRLLLLSETHLSALTLITKLAVGPGHGEKWVVVIDAGSDNGDVIFVCPGFSLTTRFSELRQPLEDLALLGLVALDSGESPGVLSMTFGRSRFSVQATALGMDVIANGTLQQAFRLRAAIEKALTPIPALSV